MTETDPFCAVKLVLVAPSHPGNIGAAARAMKCMGLHQMALVNPKCFPHADATARAAGADDVLQAAACCSDLNTAIADCQQVYGFSARERGLAWPICSPREAAARINTQIQQGQQIALVFGREHAGLDNAELDRCQHQVRFDTHPAFHSLNLASAVQLMSYELRLALQTVPAEPTAPVIQEADSRDRECFFERLETLMIELDFLKKRQPKKLMRRLRRLILRAHPDQNEINILHGIVSAVQQRCQRKSAS